MEISDYLSLFPIVLPPWAVARAAELPKLEAPAGSFGEWADEVTWLGWMPVCNLAQKWAGLSNALLWRTWVLEIATYDLRPRGIIDHWIQCRPAGHPKEAKPQYWGERLVLSPIELEELSPRLLDLKIRVVVGQAREKLEGITVKDSPGGTLDSGRREFFWWHGGLPMPAALSPAPAWLLSTLGRGLWIRPGAGSE